jgi:hypothetical protein
MKIILKIKKFLIKNFLPIFAGLIMVVGIAYAWAEPVSAPPATNAPAPINLGADTQTKAGDICTNFGGSNVCLSSAAGTSSMPVGSIIMWAGTLNSIPSGWALCNGSYGTPNLQNRFIYGVSSGENPGGSGGSLTTGSTNIGSVGRHSGDGGTGAQGSHAHSFMPPYFKLAFIMKMPDDYVNTFLTGGSHSQSSCASAGGTVVSAGGAQICQFNAGSCPSGWSQYSNWRTTTTKTCSGTGSCGSPTSCTTGSHTWGNASVENCSYSNTVYHNDPILNLGEYCSLSMGEGGSWGFCNPSQWYSCTPYYEGGYICYNTYGEWIGWGWCTTDYNNSYGCGSYTYNTYCTTSSSTCLANITQVGCY